MKQMSLVSLLVKDYDETIEFYTNKLGFVVAEDLPFGEKRWVTLKLPDNCESAIALGLAETNEDLALVGRQAGSTPMFGILTDDCLGEYDRMKNAGVTFHGEPQVEPYGTGVMLEDLYGNKIYMNQEPS
ncbi:MAG TPA: VOC family protein [Blastocatellia bacterium]|jgi:catechol 2,3-dioxygenase-like lactoylglutathione lyase family enzyme|nr:VOC family protein [Blastocatellia bacterium]